MVGYGCTVFVRRSGNSGLTGQLAGAVPLQIEIIGPALIQIQICGQVDGNPIKSHIALGSDLIRGIQNRGSSVLQLRHEGLEVIQIRDLHILHIAGLTVLDPL